MDDTARLDFLAARVQSLSREKEAALAALTAAARLGHFETSYSRLPSPRPILQVIVDRVREFAPLAAGAIQLVDEASHDFTLALTFGQAPGFAPEAEIEALIADHSFAYALSRCEPTFFTARSGLGRLLLHPLATPSRTRGMFLALVPPDAADMTDIALALLTVVLNAGAQALESFSLYQHLKEINQGLERTVESRTAALRASHDQLRMILESIQAGVVVIDPDSHRILDVNPAGAAMMGQSRDALVGRLCFDCFCPAQRGSCPIVDGGQPLFSVERVIRTDTGRELPILKSAVLATVGDRTCVIESFVDLSEQKKLAQLRDDVERITRHDLKAPLTGIIGLPDILLDDPTLSEEHRELVRLIKESGLNMLGLINLSLDLYKMETGTYVLAAQPVDLAAVLPGVARNLGPHARAKDVAIRFETGGRPGLAGPLLVLGEKLLYVSLFANLLKNAVEASPGQGEVTVSLVGRDRIWVSIHNAGAVPGAVRDRFFEKYATSGKFGGTGLGAYSARLIVGNLGGDIAMLTGDDQGTTLFLTLPRPACTSGPDRTG